MHHYWEKLLRIVESMVGRSKIMLLTHGKYMNEEDGTVCDSSDNMVPQRDAPAVRRVNCA